MSNKNNINDFFNITSSEFKPSISNIKIIDKNSIQKGGNYSPTSSFNQLGGNVNNDVNNLVSMLTSDSHMSTILNSNTSTPELENKLRKLLNQEGGNKNNISYDNVNNYFIKQNVNQKGGDVATVAAVAGIGALLYGLSSENTSITQMVSNLVGSKNDNSTTTDINNTASSAMNSQQYNDSATSSAVPSQQYNNSVTSSEAPMQSQQGGAYYNSRYNASVTSSAMNSKYYNNSITSSVMPIQRQSSISNASVTSSAMPSQQYNDSLTSEMDINQEGGNNPALVAYRDIVKMLVKELDIKYPQGLKIAAQLQKDVKEKNSNVTPDKLLKLASEEFKSNKGKYEKMVSK
jgi:hypothetical protein